MKPLNELTATERALARAHWIQSSEARRF